MSDHLSSERPRRGRAIAGVLVVARTAGPADQVFTPFHRVGGDSTGAGLGLGLVRQIARLHGGDATVAPRPGQPSCLRVSLPAP